MRWHKMTKTAVRAYTQKLEKPKEKWSFKDFKTPLRHPKVLVFDTETTDDQYQNLKFGSFQIYHNGNFQYNGLFYNPEALDKTEKKNLDAYSRKHDIEQYTLDEFVDKVFYPEVFELKTLCIGFNLPFDLSRLAKRYGDSRGKNRGGFTFTLSDDPFKPPIIIKQLGESYIFKFTTTKQSKGENHFPGYFLDAQRLAEVLLKKKEGVFYGNRQGNTRQDQELREHEEDH